MCHTSPIYVYVINHIKKIPHTAVDTIHDKNAHAHNHPHKHGFSNT